MTPWRYLALLALASVFALLGVTQSARVISLESRVARLDRHRAELADENRRLLCNIYTLTHPARIADEVERLDIALLDPVELSKSSQHNAAPVSHNQRQRARR